MSIAHLSALQSEWITLQTQFDSYEKCSLAIKLFSVFTCCLLIFALHAGVYTLLVVLILWLQDGIWKTFQTRIGKRLETVEQAIQEQSTATQALVPQAAMQFNLAWQHSRPNAIGLISEYVKQSLKPTVAYPHLASLILTMLHYYVR